jgi:P27 family predicted phage terminase small subunit
MRGRKPKPTARKRLDGNPGKRALNDAEPVPQTPDATFDDAPIELDDFPGAAAEWRRLAPMLRQARQVSEVDRSAMIALCLEWDRYLSAMVQVKKAGMVVKAPGGYPMTNPYLSIALRALAGCGRLWPELGLTPSSRARLKTDGPGPDGDPFSEFDAAPAAPTRAH